MGALLRRIEGAWVGGRGRCWRRCRSPGRGRFGNGLGSRWRWFEASGYPSASDISPKNVGVFVLGELDGLVQGLAEISESGGGFGFEVPLGESGENPAEGGAEVARGEVIAKEERRHSFSSLRGSAGLRFLLGVVVAEIRVAGAARSAAPAAIGKGERTQAGTVLFRRDRKAVLFMRDRKTVDFRGRRSLQKRKIRFNL